MECTACVRLHLELTPPNVGDATMVVDIVVMQAEGINATLTDQLHGRHSAWGLTTRVESVC